jgi:serpin B
MYCLTGFLILVLVGCSPGSRDTGSGDGLGDVSSDLPRQEIPELPLDDVDDLAAWNNQFAFDLFSEIQDQSGNLFYSPYSISAALAMTYAGARGETAQEMAETLYFSTDQQQLHNSFNALDQYLVSLAEQELPENSGEPFQLRIANALWGQQDFQFEESFLDLLAQNYGAGLRLLDYVADPEGSRQIINDWISDQTEERIQDLIPQGAIDNYTRLVLSNAIYFKAAWQEKFEESLTQEETFYGLDGETQVEMMRPGSELYLPYFQGDGFQAVQLPYAGNDTAMLVILPDEGEYLKIEDSFNSEDLNRVLDGMSSEPIQLSFPKFEFESELSLAPILAEMGMSTAFSDEADFSGMTMEEQLFISDVFHKAFVKVDEEGTEAAAATAVVMKATSAGPEPLTLTVDRPFLFLIREVQTNSILFMGRIVSP